MLKIETSILKYLDHLEDTEYLAAIVTSTSLSELFNVINKLLRSENYETFDLTCLFIRDLVLLGNRHDACKEFVENYPESSIVETLEHLLFCVNHFTRKQVIYTLGKTCSYSSVYAMNQAFDVLRDTDPLLLPKLIYEMVWLGTENFCELIENMITSQVYITRWATLETLSQFGDDAQAQDEIFQIKCKFFEQLRQDSNILVRLEAEYKYQILEFRRDANALPTKSQRQKKRKELERYKPDLCFDTIKSTFENYLSINDLYQYSINELEAFIEDMKVKAK